MIINIENNMEAYIRGGNYKYSSTFNVIFSQLTSLSNHSAMIKSFMDVLRPSRTIFILVNSGGSLQTPERNNNFSLTLSSLFVYPALIAVPEIHKHPVCDPDRSTITYLCNGYCKSYPTQISGSLTLSNFDLIHRSLFTNANGKVIPTVVADLFGYTIRIVHENRPVSACLMLVKSLNSTCSSDIMMPLVFGKVHNASILLIKQNPGQLTRYKVKEHYSTIEHISYLVSFSDSNIPLSTINQLQFERFDSNVLLYCKRKLKHGFASENPNSSSVHGAIWYKPFSFPIWCCIFSTFIILPIYFKLESAVSKGSVGIFNLISSTFGHDYWLVKRYIFLPCSVAFLLVVYANRLLSDVTIVDTINVIKTLRELLDLGFKIVWVEKMSSGTPQEFYHFDFKIRGLLERMNDSFVNVPNAIYLPQIMPMFSDENQKLALSHSRYRSQTMLKYMTEKIQRPGRSYNCFMVDETIQFKLYSWRVNVPNSYWFRKTLNRLVDSGLYNQWDKWSTWGHLLRLKQLDGFNFENGNPEYIQFSNIIAIYFAFMGMNLVGTILFCIEILWSRYKL
ncbi:unnamed protein product [Orchesella dallaii]|uniref:Ionotropic receptor n=1 Tax=Orchesella dallaii TaxID=48710 RepID=A0ABP1R675_9HEXA